MAEIYISTDVERARVPLCTTARRRKFGEAVDETPDGYTARFDLDPKLVQDALDWVLLERRCCPFLQLELRFEPSGGSVWLLFSGGPGVEEFLGAAGFKASPEKPS